MAGVYTEDSLKTLNKTQLIDLFQNAGSVEFRYRLFDDRNERSE